MRFNLATQQGTADAKEYLNQLIRLGKWAEIKRVSENRSLSQNSFFHLLVGYFGSQIGYFPDEAKTYVKRQMRDIFAYEKHGEVFLRSSADLTKDEMSQVIERLYLLAGNLGVELPLVDNAETRSLMMNEIERARHI